MRQSDFETQAIELIKKFEGLRLETYLCDANKKTIGYGHVILPNENYTKITEQEAEAILKKDLKKFEDAYMTYVTVGLKPNQIAALISLMFNIGVTAFKNSTLLKLINSNGKIEDIKAQFLRWKFVGKVENKGLLKRRTQEWEVYCR